MDALLAFLSNIAKAWRQRRAKQAAADLPKGEALNKAMAKDAEEIDRLSSGTVTK